VGIFRDITQRIEAERRMREAQKMEAVGALAAGVVHDVKNMLTPIGLAEEILSSEPDQSPLHQKLLRQIHKSTEAATSLMNQLLRLAREGNDEPPQLVNVNDCLQQRLSNSSAA
jgi:signal transduction histidine kinase